MGQEFCDDRIKVFLGVAMGFQKLSGVIYNDSMTWVPHRIISTLKYRFLYIFVGGFIPEKFKTTNSKTHNLGKTWQFFIAICGFLVGELSKPQIQKS